MHAWRPFLLVLVLLSTATCGGYVSVGVCGDWWCVGGPVVFTAQAGCTGCDFPTTLAVADFDLDGHEDVAGGGDGEGSVAIVFGDGKGGVRASHRILLGIGEDSNVVRAGDFDGNGVPDLAVFDADLAELRVFLGIGNGDFSLAGTPQILGTGEVLDVAAGPVDGDAVTDLVVLLSTGDLVVLLGQASGIPSPAAASPVALGVDGTRLALDTFDGNATSDVVVLDETANTLSTWLGDGTGGFTLAGAPFPAGPRPVAITSGPLDASPGADLAVVDRDDATVRVFLSNGDGTFSASAQGPFGLPVLAGLDLIVVPSPTNPSAPGDLAVAFADGLLEGDGLVGYANLGGGGFGPASDAASVGPVRDMVIANLNGDAVADLVIAHGSPGLLTAILGGSRER